ncbi:hypothetical protein DFA_10625 [Cavenderia fasciculata]|uniref:Dopey N-terminal domain-containing protein n=1 Tax=Cavenderia fasciculata TaxID=261658 RepID=F4QAS9_CACFS|nr:uncharacterized protein DFA_10625 [Cavenderia fasciculata]EGG15782.1 hypothetical protein DFA_10625 [Cavenderia fasciculata]|eukprot:XP_004354529.1 hypothetical protein DFA_10625 [Cavenderia fasciculata]
MISKRLSQCLNASLPSGCQLKALETYEIIFNRIGQDKLAKDISIYATGLFPLFHLASTDVRFKIITLYEKYFLPLNTKLSSCLNGIVSSLLPGLEEGQGEIYEAIHKLLDQFCRATSTTMFFQAIWKSMVTTPYNRQAAINFLLTRLPKDFKDDSNQVVYLPEKDLLVAQALSDSLCDHNILVQRNILEVISLHFPISLKIFSNEAIENIIGSALRVVVIKDMSLNRRLYSWLLGPQDKSSMVDINYFLNHSKQSTISSIKKLLQVNNQDLLIAFKILTYLFQKEEFQVIIGDIFYDILKIIYQYKDGYTFSKDIIRHLDDLLDTINDQQVIWDYLIQLISNIGDRDQQENIDNVKLVECFLDIMTLSVEEVQNKHLPLLLLSMIKTMKSDILSKNNNGLILHYTQLSLKIIGKIIINDNNNINNNNNNNANNYTYQSIETYQSYFVDLYDYLDRNLSLLQPPTNHIINNPISLSSTNNNTLSNPLTFTPISSFAYITSTDLFIILDLSLQVLVGLFQQFKTSPTSPITSPILESSSPPKWFSPIYKFCLSENPFISCLTIKSFINLTNRHGSSGGLGKSLQNIITIQHLTELSKKLWSLLDPNNCAVHYKVATLFLSLREINESACAKVIAEAMSDSNLNTRIEGYQKFALFWRLTGELGTNTLPFSNTLFLMLDSLNHEQPIIRLTGHTWLADSISKAERILDPLLKILLDKSTVRFNNFYQSFYDTRRVIYAFKIFKSIIECDFKLFIQHVIEKPISKDILQLNELQTLSYRESPKSYSSVNPHNNDDLLSSPSPLGGDNTYLSFSSVHPPAQSISAAATTTETSSDFLFIPTNYYIDLLVVVALRFIQGQVSTTFDKSTPDGESFVSQNDTVQICAAEFLQYLLSQTSMQHSKALEIANNIQEPILQTLAQAVSSSNMVLQVHLLSLLRSIVLIDSSSSLQQQQQQQQHTPSMLQQSNYSSGGSSPLPQPSPYLDNNGFGSTSLSSITQSPMFLQTTVVGLIQPSTRFNIRFYWLDFITFCLPRMVHSAQLPNAVITIVNCLRDLISSFDPRSLYDSLTSRDIIVLLKSLTFIFKFSILEPLTPFDKINQEEQQINRGGALGGVRILTDFVKDVFTSEIDQSISLTPIGKVRDDIFHDLPAIISPLLKIWGPPKSTLSKISISTDVSSDTHNKYAIQDLVIHILDPLMSKYPTQFIGAIVELWQRSLNSSMSSSFPSMEDQGIMTRKVIMEIVFSLESVREETLLGASSHILASLHAQERMKPHKSIIHKITMKESALYDFIYRYIEEYSSTFEMISSHFLAVVRESTHSSNPMSFVSQLQILNIYTKKTLPEEKSKNSFKYRNNKRDLQDIIPKIVEACFMISGKSFNDISAMYIPPAINGNQQSTPQESYVSTTPTSSRPTSMDMRSISISSGSSGGGGGSNTNEYTYASTTISEENNQQQQQQQSQSQQLTPQQLTPQSQKIRTLSSGEDGAIPRFGNLKKEASRLKTQVSLKSLVHLSTTLASLLDSIFDDKERIATLLANTLHNVVPYIKSKIDINRENTYYAICLFSSLAEFSYNIKSIRKDALELFNDHDFFKADIKTLEQTGKIINQVMVHDKTALSDFMKNIGKSWTAVSTMFVNRETENMNRSKQLKRLSYIIWCGSENQYLSIMPAIQEKIVESLRIPNSTVLHLQVFLLLRVLLLRISHQNLRSFWPIILSELIDILSHPSDNGELVLSACKFLDLALTIPTITEQFNLFEWVFIKDCFVSNQNDAPFKPLVDQISSHTAMVDHEILDTTCSKIPILTSSGIVEIDYHPHQLPTPSPLLQPSRHSVNAVGGLANSSNSSFTNSNFNSSLLRPCIMIKSIQDLPNGYSDFKLFLSRFSSSIYKRHMRSSQIDYQFINEMICLDFCEIDSNKLTSILLSSTSINDFGSILLSIHQQQQQLQQLQQQQLQQQQQQQNETAASTTWTRGNGNQQQQQQQQNQSGGNNGGNKSPSFLSTRRITNSNSQQQSIIDDIPTTTTATTVSTPTKSSITTTDPSINENATNNNNNDHDDGEVDDEEIEHLLLSATIDDTNQ